MAGLQCFLFPPFLVVVQREGRASDFGGGGLLKECNSRNAISFLEDTLAY